MTDRDLDVLRRAYSRLQQACNLLVKHRVPPELIVVLEHVGSASGGISYLIDKHTPPEAERAP